jgi:hypothetical protein
MPDRLFASAAAAGLISAALRHFRADCARLPLQRLYRRFTPKLSPR